ncbi:MAG: DegT/DnrJ/EryC1/StrS family aminotransferase [Thermodesulfobacteriota bacterium]
MSDSLIKVAEPIVGEEEAEAVRQVLLSGNYVSGAKVAAFEAAFADYIGTTYAVAVSNGTSALYIALEAMGIGPGDEVIVPPLTFFATVSSVLYLGAVPVFADLNLDDLCLSPASVQDRITPRTKAILPVHLFGAAAKMDRLLEIAGRHGIPVLEDCAQAHGTEFRGKKTGSLGRAGAFSFFATKHMTTGEGGMITTNDPDIVKTAKILRSHGMTGRDDHVLLGYNNRMTEMEAAMGLVQLGKLDELNRKRIANSEYLLERVRELAWAHVPVPAQNVKHTYFWCPVMIREESGKTIQGLKDHLKTNRIEFRQRYDSPLYRQPVMKKIDPGYADLRLPNVEKVAGQVIGLPNHPGLTKEMLERIVAVLRKF